MYPDCAECCVIIATNVKPELVMEEKEVTKKSLEIKFLGKIPVQRQKTHTSASASACVAKAVCPSCQRNSRLLQSEDTYNLLL